MRNWMHSAILALLIAAVCAACARTQESTTLGIGSTMLREKDGMKMVYVPAGDFLMGSNEGELDEQPEHTVYLDAYWIDMFEVTNAQYAQCVEEGVCTEPVSYQSRSLHSYYDNKKYKNYPVIYVDYDQAQSYCEWVGGSLPTEAQWEKAARGTDGRIYPWGNESPDSKLLNYGLNDEAETMAVGSFPKGASPYGALDMAGNVWEWVADWYEEEYYASSPEENPQGPDSGDERVQRGGSYYNPDDTVRVSKRIGTGPGAVHYVLGFRCAVSP